MSSISDQLKQAQDNPERAEDIYKNILGRFVCANQSRLALISAQLRLR